ncbi:uracil-DNA glycosylase family protein [Pontibacter sp. H259]|uniref:uracil-DNA glycosylase family protein n=1 Tax=Pontibacter sp. H259 TaxID=3133421 RepID=UPI0030C4E2FE
MKYLDRIKDEPRRESYTKADLLKNDYLIASETDLDIYYAPFDYINKDASVVIVGITPGWTQMEKSYRTLITELNKGNSYENALRKVKSESSFAGSMRTNLVKMLDELGLHKKLNITSTSELFGANSDLLHSTSALRYPVFTFGKNYTGSTPSPLKNKLLWSQIETHLVSEISMFIDALIVPLGKNVNDILLELKSSGSISNNNILSGFPHPSGANGHRAKQFEANKTQMMKKIEQWQY